MNQNHFQKSIAKNCGKNSTVALILRERICLKFEKHSMSFSETVKIRRPVLNTTMELGGVYIQDVKFWNVTSDVK